MTVSRYHRVSLSAITSLLPVLVVCLLLLGGGAVNIDVANPDSMVWESRAEFPGGGRHHPITFGNKTHAFVLSGSTMTRAYTSDFWMYEASSDTWKNLTGTPSDFPGSKRSYGYGVASLDCENPKAYLGFGAGEDSQRLSDWWEFDMATHDWKQLADFPGEGRRHPAMNFVEATGEIHVGLGDGTFGNYKDYWSYNIARNQWNKLEDFPSTERHHPFYFSINSDSYVGLGHSNGFSSYIERDWYRYDALSKTWNQEGDFVSYSLVDSTPLTIEARVAGTQFSVAESCNSDRVLGFVLSGDGSNHGSMETGEFHVYDSQKNMWNALPPHPGPSRWAPGSFVIQNKAYLLGGYDRTQQILFNDLWTIDVTPLFEKKTADPLLIVDPILVESNAASRNWNLVGLLSVVFTTFVTQIM